MVSKTILKYFIGSMFIILDLFQAGLHHPLPLACAMFFKIINVIVELEGPPLVQYSTLISSDELEVEMSTKLKNKWVEELANLTNFSKENIKAWTIDYVNFNNNISIIVNEA